MKLILTICVAVSATLVSLGIAAQESDSEPDTEQPTEATEAAPPPQEEQPQTQSSEEDAIVEVFDPSEDLSEDYAVPFPTDI